MPEQKFLSELAGWIYLAGFIPFIISVFRGYRPPKASWLIWAVLDTLYFVDMYHLGTLNGMVIGVTVGVWVIVLLNFVYDVSGWTYKQKWYLAGALFGVVTSIILGSGNLSIAITSAVVLLGAIETFVDAWENPTHHNVVLSRMTWTLWAISCVIGIMAISTWTFASYAQPVTFLIIDVPMAILVIWTWRPVKKKLKFV